MNESLMGLERHEGELNYQLSLQECKD